MICRRRRANGSAQQPAAQQPISIDDSESASEEDQSGESSNSDSDAEDANSPASTGNAASPAVSEDAAAPFDVMLTCVSIFLTLCFCSSTVCVGVMTYAAHSN